jgi:hypothetical protein
MSLILGLAPMGHVLGYTTTSTGEENGLEAVRDGTLDERNTNYGFRRKLLTLVTRYKR